MVRGQPTVQETPSLKITKQNGLEAWLKQKSTCFASSKPSVQTSMSPKKKKRCSGHISDQKHQLPPGAHSPAGDIHTHEVNKKVWYLLRTLRLWNFYTGSVMMIQNGKCKGFGRQIFLESGKK
jgi:hypothetical protein